MHRGRAGTSIDGALPWIRLACAGVVGIVAGCHPPSPRAADAAELRAEATQLAAERAPETAAVVEPHPADESARDEDPSDADRWQLAEQEGDYEDAILAIEQHEESQWDEADPRLTAPQLAALAEIVREASEIWLAGHIPDRHEEERTAPAELARARPLAARLLARTRALRDHVARAGFADVAESIGFWVERAEEPTDADALRVLGGFEVYEMVLDAVDELVGAVWRSVDAIVTSRALRDATAAERCELLRARARIATVRELDDPRQLLAEARFEVERARAERRTYERQLRALIAAAHREAEARGDAADAAARRTERAIDHLELPEVLRFFFDPARVDALDVALRGDPGQTERENAAWLRALARAAADVLAAPSPPTSDLDIHHAEALVRFYEPLLREWAVSGARGALAWRSRRDEGHPRVPGSTVDDALEEAADACAP